MSQVRWVGRWRFRLMCAKHLLFHDSASPAVCQRGCGCCFWHILPLRWFSCMRSCCCCSKRHGREILSFFLESHLCLYLLLESSQTVIKDSNFHKNLCMKEATLETGGSVIFISTKCCSLIRAPVSLCHCKEIADNHSVNLCSNRRWPLKLPGLIHGRSGGQSLICPLMRQSSSRQTVDVWFVTIQGQPAEGNPPTTSWPPLFRLQMLSLTALKELLC